VRAHSFALSEPFASSQLCQMSGARSSADGFLDSLWDSDDETVTTATRGNNAGTLAPHHGYFIESQVGPNPARTHLV